MRLDTSMITRMEQKMILAPRMIQSREILRLPIMALQERIQQELQENPVLEQKDAEETPADGEAATAETDEAPAEPAAEEEADGDSDLDFERLEALSRDWE